jgi:hypothetical protein
MTMRLYFFDKRFHMRRHDRTVVRRGHALGFPDDRENPAISIAGHHAADKDKGIVRDSADQNDGGGGEKR